jgi:competence protein ComEA
LLLAVVLVLGGRHLAGGGAASQAAPAPVAPIRADAGPALVVHVVGAVHRPGLYRFSEHSRVADAVARAGGATRHADLTLINLAAPLADGTQVVVPVKTPAAGMGSTAGSATAPAGPVHLNVATLEQLDSLPGVGPVTAQKILDYRQKHGAFSSLEELDAIPGIGPARIEQLRDAAAP